MYGYRRRSAAAYLLGVAAAFVLAAELGGALLPLPERPYWGLIVGDNDVVRRVVSPSPSEAAGIEKGDEIVAFAGATWQRTWERTYREDGSARVTVRSAEGTLREVWVERAHHPPAEVARLYLTGLVVLCFVVTGLVVFLSRSDTVATLFYLMCLLFSRIILPNFIVSPKEAVFLNKIVLDLASLFLPPVLLHFFLLFPRRYRFLTGGSRRAWLLYVPAIVAMPLAIQFDVDLVLESRAVSRGALVFQTVMALIFTVMITLGVASFLQGVRNVTSPPLRRSVRWVLPGTALGILPPLLVMAILNVFPTLEFPGDRYVFVTFALVPLSFGHAIFRYGLMDVELVVKRSFVYAMLTALLVALYYVVAEGIGRWLVERTGIGHTILAFAVVFATALLFLPARDRVQEFVDRKLYRRRYSFRKTIREFSRAFATFLERDEIVSRLVNRLPEILQVERSVLFIRSPSDDSLVLAGSRSIGASEIPYPCFRPSPSLLAWWREFGGPVPVDPRTASDHFDRLPAEEANLLRAIDPEILVFLPHRERKVEGVLFLGRKVTEDPYRSHDLELLATLGDQAGTALAGARFHEEALERRRLEEELAVARRIQASLLPAEIPRQDGVDIAALTRPCQQVGGDFYDFLDFGPRSLGIAVADVSGKGVPAALILSGLQATLRAEAAQQTSPAPVVQKINERLCADVQPGSFASLLYGNLDLEKRKLRYVNAGHPAGLVVRRDGTLERLDEGGILLGVEPTATYVGGERSFASGDLLLLYSDGVTDVLNAEDEEFGPSRLEALLPRLTHLPGSAILDRIVASVESFVGGALPDDLTLLVTKFLPTSPSPETSA